VNQGIFVEVELPLFENLHVADAEQAGTGCQQDHEAEAEEELVANSELADKNHRCVSCTFSDKKTTISQHLES
jgi:hypothetical protein